MGWISNLVKAASILTGLATFTLVCTAAAGFARAQGADVPAGAAPASDPEATEPDPASQMPAALDGDAPAYTDRELDDFVAPIALYPDALLSQVLVAATFPEQIHPAKEWIGANGDLKDDERSAAAANQGWDVSVSVLAAGFPAVIERMAKDMAWTEGLGDAMLLDSDGVLDAVQRQRARADALGNLMTNDAQEVTRQDGAIYVAPADPEVVYVPAYNPDTVYVAAAPPAVIVEDDDKYSSGDLLLTGVIAFGAGMIVNEIFDDDDDWYGYWGPRRCCFDWHGDNFYPRPGGAFSGNDVNINVDDINIDRNGGWKPDRARQDKARQKVADREGVRAGQGDRPGRQTAERERQREAARRNLAARTDGKSLSANLPKDITKRDRPAGSISKGKGKARDSAFDRQGRDPQRDRAAQDRGKKSAGARAPNRKTPVAKPQNARKPTRPSGGHKASGGAFEKSTKTGKLSSAKKADRRGRSSAGRSRGGRR